MQIVFAVDLRSASAEAEIAEAVRWAISFGATLDLAFVDDYEYSAYRIRDRSIRDTVVAQWGRVQQSHRAELDRLVDDLPDAVRGKARYLQGRAAPALRDIEGGYDLLVVSTRGRTGLAHAFLGSVAERIVRESTIPVLVLRREAEVDDGHAGT